MKGYRMLAASDKKLFLIERPPATFYARHGDKVHVVLSPPNVPLPAKTVLLLGLEAIANSASFSLFILSVYPFFFLYRWR